MFQRPPVNGLGYSKLNDANGLGSQPGPEAVKANQWVSGPIPKPCAPSPYNGEGR